MRRFIVLLSLFSTSLFAQWTDPQIRVEMADGRAQVFDVPRPPAGDLGVIVEFRDPPLCERSGIAAKAAKAEYDAAFRRFRSDIKASSNIRYEYYELFNGVALKASAAELAAIRQLPYVKAIHADVEVRAFSATPPANITKIRADQVWSTYEHDAESFAPGSDSHFEILHLGASDGIAYWVGFQQAMVHMRGRAEAVPFNLRVTEVFRREGDDWKLIHRHADSLPSEAEEKKQ